MNDLSDPFYAEIRKTAVGTFEITIPIKNMRFEGWSEGDELRIIAQKISKKI